MESRTVIVLLFWFYFCFLVLFLAGLIIERVVIDMEYNESYNNEIWKEVAEYEGYYEVSNYGRIRSMDRIDSYGRKQKGKMLKPYKNKGGYLKIKLNKNNERRTFFVHRLVAQAFLIVPFMKCEINHIDHDKANNWVGNLEWVDRSENMKKSYEYGKRNKKLSNDEMEYIRKRFDDELSCLDLAKKFGVTMNHVFSVVNTQNNDLEYQ